MADSLDKVIDTAKKLRKFAKKVNDPAFVNLIADLNMALADLKMQLVDRGQVDRRSPASETPIEAHSATPDVRAVSTTAQVSSKFDSIFGTGPQTPS